MLSLLLLPQLEQKGRLQRLVAKDVSARFCWGCQAARASSGDTQAFLPGAGTLGKAGCCAGALPCPAHTLLLLQVQPPDPARIRVLRGHQLPVTCLVISPDDKFIFSASKDGSLIKCKCSPGAGTDSQAQTLQAPWCPLRWLGPWLVLDCA